MRRAVRSAGRRLAAIAVGWCASSLALAASYTLNFKNTDIGELIRFVADATESTIIIDPRVKGRIRVISSQSVNERELYDLFLTILDVQGYAATRSGKVITVVPKQEARTMPVPTVDVTTRQDNREMVTTVVPLRNVPAAQLISVLRPLISQQGHMAAYAPSNAIIMAEVAENIARILDVVRRLDEASSDRLETHSLKYANASEVKRAIEALMQKESAGKGRALTIVADDRTNSLLVTADAVERQRIRELIGHLDSPLAQSAKARVVYLKFADAPALAPVLAKLIQNFQLPGDKGNQATIKPSVEADEATNALLITADPEMQKTISAIIDQLDIRRAQVLVEAIIVEVSDDNLRQLGIEWLLASESRGLVTSSNESPALQAALSGFLGAADGAAAAGVAGALINVPGQNAALGDINADRTRGFGALITALNQDSAFNVLSTPNLLTLDNTEATIVVGQNVPFRTGSYVNTGIGGAVNPFQTISREDVGITLKVKPSINEGDSVLLEISQEISSVADSAALSNAVDIITNKRNITTTVLADNGQIIVLGGLIREDISETRRRVPLLGSLPVLGRLFRSSSVRVVKNNLLLFIRPTIIRNQPAFSRSTIEQYKRLRASQRLSNQRGASTYSLEDIPMLNAWEELIRDPVAIPPAAPGPDGEPSGDRPAGDAR